MRRARCRHDRCLRECDRNDAAGYRCVPYHQCAVKHLVHYPPQRSGKEISKSLI